MKKDSSAIAVIRSGAIGDSFVLFPLLAALRARYPTARLTVIGRREVFGLAQEDGWCDGAVSPDSIGLWTLYSDDVEPDARMIPVLAGSATVYDFDGAKLPAGRGEFLGVADWRTLPPLPPAESIAPAPDFYLQAAGLGTRAPWLWQPPTRAAPSTRPMLAVAPGAGSIRKRASAEWFVAVARLARRRGVSVAVVKGEADREALAEYEALGGPMDAVFDQLPLSELRIQLSRCRFYVGNDSGISHLAAYVGIPTVIRFVASDPRVWAPRGPNVLVVPPNTRVKPEDLWDRFVVLPSIHGDFSL